MPMALLMQKPLIVVFSVVRGAVIGELIRIEDMLGRGSEALKKRLRMGNPRFTEGFVGSTVLFCIGSMAILGPFDEGLRGDLTIILTKSILDGFAAIALGAALGVLFLLFQLFFTKVH